MFREYLFASGVRFQDIIKDEVTSTLQWLHSTGYKVGLASAGPNAFLNAFISACGLEDYFDEVVSGESISKNKPDPMIYNTILNYLELSAEDCIVVEDSEVGILAAKSAEIKTVALKPNGYFLNQESADVVIDNIAEIRLILENE